MGLDALGRRPKKEYVNRAQARKLKRERAERNHIEGKFGQGKRKYGLGIVLVRLEKTQQSLVAAAFFVMNIIRMSEAFFWLILEWMIFGQKLTQNQFNLLMVEGEKLFPEV